MLEFDDEGEKETECWSLSKNDVGFIDINRRNHHISLRPMYLCTALVKTNLSITLFDGINMRVLMQSIATTTQRNHWEIRQTL